MHDYQEDLESRKGKKRSIREALAAVSMFGRQGFYYCHCEGKFETIIPILPHCFDPAGGWSYLLPRPFSDDQR
jgi:hypothetical protein